MGNHAAVGHSMNFLGVTDVVGFENSAKAVINLHGIEPWNAMDLVRDNLRKQAELARRTPLRKVPVEEGLQFIKNRVIHNNTRPRLCCEPTRAQSSSIQKDFDIHPGKNTLARQDAHEMPATDLEACMKRCKERGDGAFVVWRNKAYFKSQSEVVCRKALFNDRDGVTYLNMVPKSEDFDIHEAMNTLTGKDAYSMSGNDIPAFKKICCDKGYGAFVVWRGVAHFKSYPLLACREGLQPDKEATTYLNLAPQSTWRGWMKAPGELEKDDFVKMCCELLDAKSVQYTPKDRREFGEVFDSIDFDGNGSLSIGEWAGGLSVFFKGSPDSSVHAVFKALDKDNDRKLSKAELQEYLKPLVKAMSPPKADSLRPILLKKATDDIFREMDLDNANDISSDEMLQWTRKDNNIVDRLAGIIDKEVYQIWLTSKQDSSKAVDARTASVPPKAGADGQDPVASQLPGSMPPQNQGWAGSPDNSQSAWGQQPPGGQPGAPQQSWAAQSRGPPPAWGSQQGSSGPPAGSQPSNASHQGHWWDGGQQPPTSSSQGYGQPQGSGGAQWGGQQQGASGQDSWFHASASGHSPPPPPPAAPQRKLPLSAQEHYGPAPP